MGRRILPVAGVVSCLLNATLLSAQVVPPGPPPPPPVPMTGFPAADQIAREGTGLIVGRVLDAGSGRAVPAAIVSVTGAGVSPSTGGLRVLTDNDGQFVFRNLPSGTVSLTTTKGGYLPGAYGRRTPNGPTAPLELTDGQRLGDVTLFVWKAAAITGAIVDELGEPVVGIEVRGYRRTFVSGRPGLRPEGFATTDDRGIYRMYNLTPGPFLVAVVSTTAAVPVDVASTAQSAMSANAPDRDAIMREMSSIGVFSMMGSSGARVGNMVQSVRGGLGVPPSKDGRAFAYPTTFYPAATASAQASAVTVTSGQERSEIDMQLRPVPAVKVSGAVIGPEGPVSTVAMRLIPSGAEVMATEVETSSTVSDGSGGFTFLGVTPGQYTLRVVRQPPPVPTQRNTTATTVQMGGGVTMSSVTTMSAPDAPLPAGPTLWESMPLSVGGTDLANVTVSLRSGTRISGRVEFEGSARAPEATDLLRIGINLEPASGQSMRLSGPLRGRVEADARFTTVGLPGGRYFLRAGGAPQGWTFKSATHEGRDLADVPVDATGGDITGVVISFTDRPTELNGTVTGSSGPDPDATVLIFPSDANAWTEWGISSRRLRAIRTSAAGTYTTKGLPAGDYYIVAVPEALAVDWQQPSTLEAFARTAAQIRIEEGEKKTQSLRTSRGAQ
jgi:hypothetical protein